MGDNKTISVVRIMRGGRMIYSADANKQLVIKAVFQGAGDEFVQICGYNAHAVKTWLKGVKVDGAEVEVRPWYCFGDEELHNVELTVNTGGFVTHDRLFAYCQRLVSAELPPMLDDVGIMTFRFCTMLQQVTLGNSIAAIGANAFEGCTALQRLSLPESVRTIGSNAFKGCSALESIDLSPYVRSIGASAFEGCSALTSLSLPYYTESLGEKALSGCTALTNLITGPLLRSIGSRAFSGVPAASLTLPATLTEVGTSALLGNKVRNVVWLPMVPVPSTAFMGNSQLLTLSIAEGVETIGASALDGSGLVHISLPSTLRTLGACALARTPLVELTLPNGVTEVPAGLCTGCGRLQHVTLPATVRSIAMNAFNGIGRDLDRPATVDLSRCPADIFIHSQAFSQANANILMPDGTIRKYGTTATIEKLG